MSVDVSINLRPSQEVSKALRRILKQPTFVAAVVVLLVAAVGLNASVQFMKLHFKKEAVPLAKSLATISEKLGPWVQVTPDQAIEKEVQDVLGTDLYVFREYVDTRSAAAGPDVAEQFRRMQTLIERENNPEKKAELVKERQTRMSQIRTKDPLAVVNLHVTYYTGMVDTVAHVPDRCMVAEGYEPKPDENKTVKWPIGRDLPAQAKEGGSDEVEVRYINFEDQTAQTGGVTRSVSYFFHVNGHFESSPLGVRRRLQNLFERHGYYAKVEVMTLIKDTDVSAKVMTDFLTTALPEIYKTLPDWDAVRRSEQNH